MKGVRSQISDIRNQIREKKEVRKSISDENKTLYRTIKDNRNRRKVISDDIKNLFGSIQNIRESSKDAKSEKREKSLVA